MTDRRELRIEAPHGLITGDVTGADGGERPAVAVVAHPHPAYGGDRFNHVVSSVVTELVAAGITAVRFDFLGDGSTGPEDLAAVLEGVADLAGGDPLVAVGYSFGADIVLAAADPRPRVRVGIAPPLRFAGAAAAVAEPAVPTVLVVPEGDQFRPPGEARALASPAVEVITVPGDDHFLRFEHALAARTAVEALRSALDRPS